MNTKNKKGISLIVLVITIIVMIILATAIILSLDSSNIVEKAKEAKTASDMANAKNIVALSMAEWELMTSAEQSVYGGFAAFAQTKLQEAGYKSEGNGGVIVTESGAINMIYIGSDNRQAIIPYGFTVSRVSTEDTVTEGLVIYEGTEAVTNSNVTEARETRNQFVWIPVDDFSKFKKTTTYNGTVTTPDSGEEPATSGCNDDLEPLSCEDSAFSLSIANDITGEWKEYNEMYESVKKNGGFYAGRYETGTNVERTYNSGTTDVLVQKNKHPYNEVVWGLGTANIVDEFNGKSAVILSRSLYDNSVKSHLMYGVEYDAMYTFLYSTNSAFSVYNRELGHFTMDETGTIETGEDVNIKTGSVEKYAIANIYDTIGNMVEWSMESAGPAYRMLRGRDRYAAYGYSYDRCEAMSTDRGVSVGFRIGLYII